MPGDVFGVCLRAGHLTLSCLWLLISDYRRQSVCKRHKGYPKTNRVNIQNNSADWNETELGKDARKKKMKLNKDSPFRFLKTCTIRAHETYSDFNLWINA